MQIRIGKRKHHLRVVVDRYIRGGVASALVRALLPVMPRSPRIRILFFGHEINGNLYAIAQALRSGARQVDWRVMVDNPIEYRRLRRSGTEGIMSSQKISHVWWAARSSAIVSSHGPVFFRSWLGSRRRPKFIDVWHGVGFKASIEEAELALLSYDAHLVSSEAVARHYQAAGASAIATGYARTDLTLRAMQDVEQRSIFRSRLGVGEKQPFVLFAPTWAGFGVDAAEGRLGSSHDVLRELSSAAISHDFTVGYRGHINSAGQNLDELPNVKLIDRDTAPITEELLGIVDVLITDWSSIATDFMVTGRPIVYLDRQPPREHPAPLDGADRIGEVVSDYESLVAAVIDAVANPELYQSRFSEARAVTIEKAWGKTLDGHSTDRSITAIEEVVGQGSNRSGPVH